MIRLFGKFCFIQALFLFPMSIRLFGDALDMAGSTHLNPIGSGAWIIFAMLFSLMVLSGWFGLRTIRK